MAVILDWWETIKKYKQSKHCHNKQNFFLFFVYVDGMLGREDLVVITQLSQTMAKKMDEYISHVRGWINGQIEIAVSRS